MIAAEEARNVLVLLSASRVLPANIERERGLRQVLETSPDRPIELYVEFLDVPRFEGDSYVRAVTTFLRDKYALHPPEVIVAGGDTALEFLLSNRALLFPHTPVVHSGITTSFLRSHQALPDDVIGTPVEYDTLRTIELAFHLRPKATRLVLVTGTDPWGKSWEARLRSDMPRFPAQAKPEFLVGLSTAEVRKRLAELGEDAVVFTPGYFRDGDGKVSTPLESVRIMAAASAAPVYGPLNPFVGAGAVGGYVTSFEAMGQQAGQTVKALLDGATPASLRSEALMPIALNVDWRQIRRWRIDEMAIPREAIVQFREPTLLEAHRTEVYIAIIVFLLQAGLIVGLLVERRRRRIAEGESRARLSEMAHMNRRVALGEMSASIAHELNQPLGAIRNNAGAAELMLKADPPRLEEVAEILGDIKRDDQRASEIIARIRQLLRKTEFELRDMDLNEAIDESMKMLAAEALANDVSLRTALASGLRKVSADRVQVQQVILNLALNAIEAMQGQPVERRLLTIRSRRANDKEAEVSVADSGVGIPADSIGSIFDAFVTTKPNGMGLGLAISRTIVEAHGGQINAENAPAGGAVIRFTLPFASASPA